MRQPPYFEYAEEPDYCLATRGPRGRVFCESRRGHVEDPNADPRHMGRGERGQWFVWEEKK